MALLRIIERREGRSGEETKIEDTASSSLKAYARLLRAEAASSADEEDDVLGDALVPSFGALHPVNGNARLVQKRAARVENSKQFWDVTLTYSESRNTGPGSTDPNPLNRPAEYDFETVPAQELVLRGIYLGTSVEPLPDDSSAAERVIGSSAGESFEIAPTADRPRPVLSVVRNILNWNVTTHMLYRTALNSDTFFGFAAGQAKIYRIKATRKWDQTYGFYFTASYEIHFKESWIDEYLDEGTRQFSDPLVQETDKVENLTSKTPLRLDGKGRKLKNQSPAVGIYLRYRNYPKLPFAALGLF